MPLIFFGCDTKYPMRFDLPLNKSSFFTFPLSFCQSAVTIYLSIYLVPSSTSYVPLLLTLYPAPSFVLLSPLAVSLVSSYCSSHRVVSCRHLVSSRELLLPTSKLLEVLLCSDKKWRRHISMFTYNFILMNFILTRSLKPVVRNQSIVGIDTLVSGLPFWLKISYVYLNFLKSFDHVTFSSNKARLLNDLKLSSINIYYIVDPNVSCSNFRYTM